jgi:hypothetical protein
MDAQSLIMHRIAKAIFQCLTYLLSIKSTYLTSKSWQRKPGTSGHLTLAFSQTP